MPTTTPTTPTLKTISITYYNEGGSVMVLDKMCGRSFFIDHRIGTNTRGQVFETVRGERVSLSNSDIDYVRDLFKRAADQVLDVPDKEWQIKRRYYIMLEEIINDAINTLP